MARVCRICGNAAHNKIYTAREMMFGSREQFEYFECSQCGCVQIFEIPSDMGKYYPENYYAFTSPEILKSNRVITYLLNQRTRKYLGDESLIGRLALRKYGKPNLSAWVFTSGIHADSKILDVGCGTGHLLVYLKNEGFSNLTGIDPYIQQDIFYENGVKIFKRDLDEIDDSYDFIMLHHAFEHIADPLKTINELYRKTRHNGMVLIRMPIASSYAWRTYRTDWVQLDAPRHFYIHTVRSMDLLSKRAGFKVEMVEYDSDAFQFWGSEQYQKDIPLHHPRSLLHGINNSIFSESDIESFEKRAQELNDARDGDQAAFYLKKQNLSQGSNSHI